MGQVSSLVRGYGGGDENASEKSKVGTDSPNASIDVEEGVVSHDDQKTSADEAANVENILDVVVSSKKVQTSQLDKKLETDLVSEGRKASKPVETEDVKKAQTVLNLASELGEPPERPLLGDCCGQGCDVCVWDTYNNELRDYLARKKVLLTNPNNLRVCVSISLLLHSCGDSVAQSLLKVKFF